MKRIILQIPALLLMLVFLVSGSGLFFNIHKCNTKHIRRITFTNGESCCKTAKELKPFNKDIFLPACCANKNKTACHSSYEGVKNCCTNKAFYLKLACGYLSLSNYISKAVYGSSLNLQTGILTSLFKFNKPLSLIFFANGPPGQTGKPGIFVLYHQFLV
jgi:hypothetical protein